MRTIRFPNIPKFSLPHYKFMFSKPEQLVTELNNDVCYRPVTVLYLKIQEGKEALNDRLSNSGFQMQDSIEQTSNAIP